jgi:ribonuclease BN (tRNA processing enzyme)
LELQFLEADRRIIIDAGSGLRALGDHLINDRINRHPVKADLFLTHTHMDHIIGIPFFAPVYMSQTQLNIYGPVTCEQEPLESVIGGQLSYRYFPVRQAELAAEIEYINLKEGRFDLGDGIVLTTKYLNHPLLCFGYRFEYNGRNFCTAYDTEPFQNIFCTDPNDPAYNEAMAREGELAAQMGNSGFEDFILGADILVCDAQYTRQEYEAAKIGWGHTPVEYAIETAQRANVQTLALLHHDPMRTDAQLDALSDRFCNTGYSGDTEVFFAREGMEIEL